MIESIAVSILLLSSVSSLPLTVYEDCKTPFNDSVLFIKNYDKQWIQHNVTLENFQFRKPCSLKIDISFSNHISFDNLISRSVSSQDGSWDSKYGGNTFNTDPNASPILIAAPYLKLKFPGMTTDNSTYFIRLTIIYYVNEILHARQYLTPTKLDELQYVDLTQLVPGVTYMYGDYYGVNTYNIRRPYSNQQQYDGLDVPLFSNILVFNGTTSAADPMGFMTCLSKATDCVMGYNLQGFMLFLISPTPSNIDPELSKLLIMDKPKMDAISPVFIYFIYWNRGNYHEDESMAITVYPPDTRATYRLILVSQEEKPGIFEEFIFSGLTYYSEQSLPNMEILGGWPNDTRPSQIAKYSNSTYSTELPQQFGGRMRAFVIHSDSPTDTTNLLLINPKNTRGLANSTETEPDIAERWNKNFEPFLGRKGFIRNNWMDGTFAANRTEVLKLRETKNHTVFNFQFKFDSGCQSDASLTVSATVNGTTSHYGLNCTDSANLKVVASSIQAELTGDGVVTYEVTTSGSVMSSVYLWIAVWVAHLVAGI